MTKFSTKLLDLDDRMRSYARSAHGILSEILYSNSYKKRRRKIDKKLIKLEAYFSKIDALGYQLKLHICEKKEVMNNINHQIDKNKKKEQKNRR